MKKLYMLIFFFGSLTVYAQTKPNTSPAFENGNWYLNTGLSFGYYKQGFSGTRNIRILPTTVSVEKAFSDQFSVGAYLGYAKWDYLGDYDLEFISIGGRISWHLLSQLKKWVDLDMDQNRWDVYLSGLVGFEYRVADELQNIYGPYGSSGKFIIGPVLGVKYFFNPRIGFYAEGGRGTFGYGNAGIGFRL